MAVALLYGARWPLGLRSLIVWTMFIILFIGHTDLLSKSIGYALFLIFCVLLIFSTVQLFSTPEIYRILRWYIYSFEAVAVFGLLQMFLATLHIATLLIQQWWIPGILPRINGFSYEPSYFASYLLIGWVLVLRLLHQKSDLIPRKGLKRIAIIISLAILLSSSRLGWMMMALYMGILLIQRGIAIVKKRRRAIGIDSILRLSVRKAFIIGTVGCLALTFLLLIAHFKQELSTLNFLLAGTGVGAESSHSVDQRSSEFDDVVTIFRDSPVFGYSLGGLSSAIAHKHGTSVQSFEEAKDFEGMGVFAQVLAASGIIGFIPFAWFVISIIVKPYNLAGKIQDSQSASILRAMVWSLVFELMILQFNQNILRLYLWLHIALLVTCYHVLRCGTKLCDLRERLMRPPLRAKLIQLNAKF